jgi:hypothetical protein
MKPYNQAERRKAFLNFLLFFAITVAVIVIAVLSSVQVPLKENEMLRKQRQISTNEKSYLKIFEDKMAETTMLLDSYTVSKNRYPIDNKINNNITTMTSMLSDSTDVKSICSKIVDNLTSLYYAKKQLSDAGNSREELDAKDREIEKLSAQLQEINLRYINDIRNAQQH